MSATNLTEKKQVEFCSDIWEYCIKPFLFSVFPTTCQVCDRAKKPNELHSWRRFHGNPLEYRCERCWCYNMASEDVVKHSILNIICLEACPFNQLRSKANRVFKSIVEQKALFKGGKRSLYLEKVVIQAIIKEQRALAIDNQLNSINSLIKQIKGQSTRCRKLLKTDITGEQKTSLKEILTINKELVKTNTLKESSLLHDQYGKCPILI